MADLNSKKLVVVKGILFLSVACVSFGLLLAPWPSWRAALLLALLVWASCRFYYFLFYVLEKYVDPSLRYSGLWALVREIWRRRG